MGYRYIASAYGKAFNAGQRVKFTEDGRTGTVKRAQGDPQYVNVKFDDGREGPCHPLSVEHI